MIIERVNKRASPELTQKRSLTEWWNTPILLINSCQTNQLCEAILWLRIFSKGEVHKWETALWVISFAINFVLSLAMGFIVDHQLGVLKGQHFWLGETEDCFDKLLNHRSLFHAEDLRAFAECSKDAISTLITHSEKISHRFNRLFKLGESM